METHSFCRTVSKFFGLVALSLVFFFTGPTLVAHADYDEYVHLFDGPTNPATPPQFKILQKLRPSAAQGSTERIFDFKFNFQSTFAITDDRDGDWYWDHIDDGVGGGSNGGPTKTFLVRICEINTTTNSPTDAANCIYGPAPSAVDVNGNDIRVTGEPICKRIDGVNGAPGTTKCILPVGAEAYPKIYSNTATISTANGNDYLGSGSERTSINAIFGIPYNGFKKMNGQAANLPTIFTSETAWYKADIWYCGLPDNGISFTTAITNTYSPEQVNTFGNLCGGHPYFKIASSENFQVTSQDGTTPTTIDPTGGSTTNTNVAQTSEDNLPECSMSNGTFGSGSFVGCISYLVYYLIYWPIAWFAGIMGQLFDFFLGYSLSDASYRAEFAVRGWQIVRDICNIFFIIILVWTGLSAVFNTKTNMKSVVPQLILNALLINFSLFGTRVIIDVSNVIARVFYKSVEVCDGKCQPKDANGVIPNAKQGIAGYTPLSEKIVSAFNPQKIFSTNTLSAASALPNNGTTTQGAQKTFNRASSQYAGYFTIVSLIAAFILFAVAMMFWKTAFFFVGRVIGLYMAMIFAPFAVLTKGGMPLFSGIKELSWDTWWKDLTKYATLAPIFVFFLYVIYSFLETDFIKVYADRVGNSFFETVVYISIPMIIVYFMIKQGVSIAEDYAGRFGKMVQGFAQTAVGVAGGAALGVASGGAAFLGTRAAGLFKLSEESRTALAAKRAQGGLSGRIASMRLGLNDSAQKGTFDFRNTKAFSTLQSTTGKFGVKLDDKISGKIGLDKDANKGGIKAIEKKEKEEVKKKIESIKTDLSDDKAKEFWAKRVSDAAHKEAEEERTKALLAAGKTQAEIEEMKKTGAFTDATYTDTVAKKIKASNDERKVETNKQLTQALREEFAKTISQGGTLGQQMAAPLGALAAGAAAPVLGGLGALSNPLAAPGLMAIAYDQNRKERTQRDEAQKYFEKAEKDRKKNKLPKEDRIENEKKRIEKELEEMDKHLEETAKGFGSFFDEILQRAADGEKAFEKFATGRTKGTYDSTKDYEEVLNLYRQDLRAKTEAMEMDIKQINDEYGIAKRSGKTAEADALAAKRNDLIAQKNRAQQDLLKFNEERRSRLESDLAKKENELEKIKEKNENKEKKDSEKGGDKDKK